MSNAGERHAELTAMEKAETRRLAKLLGTPSGTVPNTNDDDRVSVLYWVNEDEPAGAFFVTVGLAAHPPLDGAEPHEIGIDVLAESFSGLELHRIGESLLKTVRQLASTLIAPEQIVPIGPLEFVYPRRSQALVTDFMYREVEYLPTGRNKAFQARLLFLRPVFEEEIPWIRTMSQAQVGEIFARDDVSFGDPKREPMLVTVGPKSVS